ncbi:MAG TPA: hypothetical protein VJQ77_03685 [Novosphingobium sp.]|nr:hypothetical protein [Novosphingobium sp.]
MKFDSNLAWKQAATAVSANREVLLALAGVFFMLPQLAFAIFYPQPEPTATMTEKEMVAMVMAYYGSVLPVAIPMALLQALGTLALLGLLDGQRRPTVGESIKDSLKGVVPYLLAQLMGVLGLMLVALPVMGALAALGGTAGAVIAVAIVAVVGIYVGVRFSLTAAVVAVERVFNPIKALVRSWHLTRRNTARLLGFYALFILAFVVILIMANVVIGIPLALLAPDHVATIIQALLGSVLSAVMALYFVAIIAASHRQLAGNTPETDSAPFM